MNCGKKMKCGCERNHLTLENKCIVTALAGVLLLFASVIAANCGTERRMCMSSQGFNAAECLQALE
jgi:hypothetical protein